MSLLEVLISMFVLSIGLLGVAALIPVGRFAILETGKADRSGACGHAAMREIKVRRMLDYRFWAPGVVKPSWWAAVESYGLPPGTPNPTSPPPQIPSLDAFAIDPLGVAREMPPNLGGATIAPFVPRITLLSPATREPITLAEAERVFMWHDDLQFSRPEDIKPPPAGDSKRPRPADLSGIPQAVAQAVGHYSWLVTVTPAAAEATLPVADKAQFLVSVVVCYRRDFTKNDDPLLRNGEHTATVKFLGQGYGGGSVELIGATPVDPPLRLRENEWIMLCGKVADARFNPPERTVCNWYRVVSADSGRPTHYVSVVGPDWTVDNNRDGVVDDAQAVVVGHVVGVYTTTVELDSSVLWNK